MKHLLKHILIGLGVLIIFYLFNPFIFTLTPVHATSNLPSWAYDVKPPLRIDFRSCSSSTNCSLSVDTDTSYMNNEPYQYSTSTIKFSKDGPGVLLTNFGSAMQKGFIYNANSYICSNTSSGTFGATSMSSFTAPSIADTYAMKYPANSLSRYTITLSNDPHGSGELDSRNCFVITDTFVANRNGSYYGVRFGSTSTATVNNFYFMGFELTQLGEYTANVADNIKDYIKDSNLASAESINEVNQSIDNLKDSITQSNKDLQDTIVDSNNQVKDEIKDNLNDCRPSHNLLENTTLTTATTKNGITATPNKDGSITLNGTSTADCYFNLLNRDFGNVPINSAIVGGSEYIASTGIHDNRVRLMYDSNNKWTFIVVYGGNTLNNVVIKPMIRSKSITDDTFEPYGEEICKNKIDETNDKLGDINNSITDPSIDSGSANDFFTGFKDKDYGLSGVITAPLNFIKTLSSKSCTPINLPLPFVNKNLTLPCMNTIYSKFGSIYTIYQTVTTSLIAYWVSVKIYGLVKGFKDPNDDRIEVMDL